MLTDLDMHPTFYHWIIFNLSANTTKLPVAFSSTTALMGENGFGKIQYNGPCPPKGSTHSYMFTLYALDKILNLTNGASANAVMAAMQGHILEKAEIKTKYGH